MKRFLIVKVVNPYSGRTIKLLVSKKKYENAEGWEWLSDHQRKQIENYFGKEQAYHCKVIKQ